MPAVNAVNGGEIVFISRPNRNHVDPIPLLFYSYAPGVEEGKGNFLE